MFYREVEKQPVVLSFQSVVLHLVFLKQVLTKIELVDFVVKLIQSVVSKNQSNCFLNFLNRIC